MIQDTLTQEVGITSIAIERLKQSPIVCRRDP